jgi:hypothetical protein
VDGVPAQIEIRQQVSLAGAQFRPMRDGIPRQASKGFERRCERHQRHHGVSPSLTKGRSRISFETGRYLWRFVPTTDPNYGSFMDPPDGGFGSDDCHT